MIYYVQILYYLFTLSPTQPDFIPIQKVDESCESSPGLKSYANVQRSYGDISTKAIWDDVTYMIFGYSVLYIFVQIMMGRFNRVEQRVSTDQNSK